MTTSLTRNVIASIQYSLPILFLSCLFLFPQRSSAQTETSANKTSQVANEEIPGIAVGETLPDITLKNQHGTDVSIQQMMKNGPVAIVFYRSASW